MRHNFQWFSRPTYIFLSTFHVGLSLHGLGSNRHSRLNTWGSNRVNGQKLENLGMGCTYFMLSLAFSPKYRILSTYAPCTPKYESQTFLILSNERVKEAGGLSCNLVSWKKTFLEMVSNHKPICWSACGWQSIVLSFCAKNLWMISLENIIKASSIQVIPASQWKCPQIRFFFGRLGSSNRSLFKHRK